jgi:protein-S-isoprenylcysteine O-methyltransferase Ste14
MAILVSPYSVIMLLWLAWAVSWFAAAMWSARTVKRPAIGPEIFYRVITVAGVLLIFAGRPGNPVYAFRFWHIGEAGAWALVSVTAFSFAFAWWARIHLGRLWSGFVTKKEGHRIVDTGPYAIVRHPIYTAIITAALCLAILRGDAFALGGFVLVTLGFWIKARFEENFLRQELGAEAYDAYAKRVPMLVPLGPKSS